MTNSWARDASVYHLYALGCLEAPARNPFTADTANRLSRLEPWLDYLGRLGVNTLLIGPLQQSSAHGYDVADYFQVDRRLGSHDSLQQVSRDLHGRGMRLLFDAVFHHTGRDFWAFQDVLKFGKVSIYRDWFHLDFSRRSSFGDPFHYEGWAGHYDLVKLNLRNPAVKEHLFAAVSMWIAEFDVDGLRLDAADRLDSEFRTQLASHCRRLKPDFWLMGEVVHGDYREWTHAEGLDSVTNYEVYKGLWSSHNDRNYFELAYSLHRQFGEGGLYQGLDIYSFADNHDVDRVASTLTEPAHLYPLYLLLMTMPGVPSLYYGSEWGVMGRRSATSDSALRPALCPGCMIAQAPHPPLYHVIRRLLAIRRQNVALRGGGYTELHVNHEQLAFMRGSGQEAVFVAANSSNVPAKISIRLHGVTHGRLKDVLNEGESFPVIDGQCALPLDPYWGRILTLNS